MSYGGHLNAQSRVTGYISVAGLLGIFFALFLYTRFARARCVAPESTVEACPSRKRPTRPPLRALCRPAACAPVTDSPPL